MDLIEMYPAAVNSKVTVTLGVLNADSTIIEVLDGSVLPDAPNLLVLGSDQTAETVKLTAKEGNTLTVERGIQGNAIAWPAGTQVARNFTAKDWDDLVTNLATIVAKIMGLSAADVHARPDTWMPTASDVGAAPNDIGGWGIYSNFPNGTSSASTMKEIFNACKSGITKLPAAWGCSSYSPDGTDGYWSIIIFKQGGSSIVSYNYALAFHKSYGARFYNQDEDKWYDISGDFKSDGSVPMSGSTLEMANKYTAIYNNENMIRFITRNVAGVDTTRRQLYLWNSNHIASVANAIQFMDTVNGTQKTYNIYGEHNKPSGSYTGNGSATSRTIDLGGIGKFVFVYNNDLGSLVLITQICAVIFSSSGMSRLPYSEAHTENNKIILATTNSVLNSNGKEFICTWI